MPIVIYYTTLLLHILGAFIHTGAFYQSVQGCTQTFAQLIHNEQKVVDLLLQHLKVKDSMALEALLE